MLQVSPVAQLFSAPLLRRKRAEGKTAKNRFHPDFVTSDLEGEIKRLVDLGATQQAEIEEGGYHWVTLSDPQGNEFDVIAV